MVRQMRPWLFADFVFYLTDYGKRYKNAVNVLQSFTNKVIDLNFLQISIFTFHEYFCFSNIHHCHMSSRCEIHCTHGTKRTVTYNLTIIGCKNEI